MKLLAMHQGQYVVAVKDAVEVVSNDDMATFVTMVMRDNHALLLELVTTIHSAAAICRDPAFKNAALDCDYKIVDLYEIEDLDDTEQGLHVNKGANVSTKELDEGLSQRKTAH